MIHYMIRWLSMAWGAFLPHLKEGDSCGGPVDAAVLLKSRNMILKTGAASHSTSR